MTGRKTAIVICPGRGTSHATERGTLSRHFPDAALLDCFESLRQAEGQDSLPAMDAAIW